MAIDIIKDLKKYLPFFQQAHDQSMNESDTSMRISKFCETVLGYDVFNEISREHAVKERNVDYAVKIDGKIQFFIEVKQAGITLKEKHIEQASNYAANAGVSWVLLSNGKNWNMYHLNFGEGIQINLVWSVDLLDGDLKDAALKLGMLHRKNICKGELDDYFAKKKILSPKSIVQAIFHENTLRLVRTHLKKSSGIRIDEDELAENIKTMISKETWEEIGEVKIIRKRKTAKPKTEGSVPSDSSQPEQGQNA
jgi:predicted type IV restriction endonuclease